MQDFDAQIAVNVPGHGSKLSVQDVTAIDGEDAARLARQQQAALIARREPAWWRREEARGHAPDGRGEPRLQPLPLVTNAPISRGSGGAGPRHF